MQRTKRFENIVVIKSICPIRRVCTCILFYGSVIIYFRYYAHTNRFCVVQENIKPEVLEVQTELARSVH